MNWIDQGFLISKNKYNENSIIAEFYTKHYGKCYERKERNPKCRRKNN